MVPAWTVGVPSVVKGRTVFNPPDLGIFADDPIKREFIVHLEELPHAPVPVQGALYEMLLDRSLNGKPVHPLVRFGASGNPLSSRGASNHLSTALRSRMVMTRFKNSIADFLAGPHAAEMPALMQAYLALMGERGQETALNGFDPRVDGNSPNPRGWVKAGVLWDTMEARGRPLPYRMVVLAGAIGEGQAAEFIGFCRTWETMPDINRIIRSPSTAPRPDAGDLSVIYATVCALAFKATKQHMAPFIIYCSLLGAEFCAAFASMATNRDPGLAETEAYVQWAAANRSRSV